MNLKDIIGFSINLLCHQKLRSCLTVLGIVVGISSIIVLVGLVQGFKQDVLTQLELFGPRTIVITPIDPQGSAAAFGPAAQLAPTAGKLFEKDYERVKRIPEIETITKVIMGRTTVVYKDQAISAGVFGVEADVFTKTLTVEIDKGRFLSENDKGVAVLGVDIAEGFDEEIKTQSNIYLADRKFRVAGTLKSTGSSFAPVDNIIFIPFDDAEELFNESMLDDEISGIRMTMKEGTDMDAVTDEVESIMIASHRVTEDEKDFGIVSPKFINESFTEIVDLITMFLGAIASISLIVGGIGISNTMFMSVMERRREIGVMKAVGATRRQIRDIFLIESSIIGLIGGILGLALASLVGLVLVYLADLTFVFEPLVIVGSVVFSITVGIISGTFPAIEAAKVDPMEALRYE
jgi:putative ABC transport system permease protein